MTEHEQIVVNLIRSNDELRGILILAGRELKKRTIGRSDSALLQLTRRTLRDARVCVCEDSKLANAPQTTNPPPDNGIVIGPHPSPVPGLLGGEKPTAGIIKRQGMNRGPDN